LKFQRFLPIERWEEEPRYPPPPDMSPTPGILPPNPPIPPIHIPDIVGDKRPIDIPANIEVCVCTHQRHTYTGKYRERETSEEDMVHTIPSILLNNNIPIIQGVYFCNKIIIVKLLSFELQWGFKKLVLMYTV
jgi:hypothetical protein